jgi:DNA-binding transcriptional LysR family regulator
MLDVRRLETLRQLGRRRSFAAAADALGYTQSAISQQISGLEREVGVTLVERGVRPVRLTGAGDTLIELAEPLFESLASLDAGLEAFRTASRGRLRLASFPSACVPLAGPALAAFHRDYPAVDLTLTVAEPREAMRELRAGDADVAILFDEHEAPTPAHGLERTPLLDDPVVLALPSTGRLARRRVVDLSDLAEEGWISPARDGPGAGYRRMFERACADAGFEPRVAHETEDALIAQSLVAAGLGLALLPRLALSVTHPAITLRELGNAPRRRVWAARVKDRQLPAAAAMLAALRNASRERERAGVRTPRTRPRESRRA